MNNLSRLEASHVASPQQANLLNKTAAAAEEFKRLLVAETEWSEERTQLTSDLARALQESEKQTMRVKRLEELRVGEAAAWRREREGSVREKEAASSRITTLIRELELKTQAEARFNLERKSWAERVERIEKVAADAKADAKSAGDEVSRLQRAYQDLFSKSRVEKEATGRDLQVYQEENADLRQRLHAVQEQFKGSLIQIDAMDRAAAEYRRGLSLLGQERDDLQKQLNNMEHEIGDVLQQLATAQDALEGEKQAHAAALEFERGERQRQQDFFGKALAEAEADARAAASQVHAQKLRVVQLERETKRLREEGANLQSRLSGMDNELTRERGEWEATYQQLTEAIATKEMEQDAAAAHLEIMLRSVGGGTLANLSTDAAPLPTRSTHQHHVVSPPASAGAGLYRGTGPEWASPTGGGAKQGVGASSYTPRSGYAGSEERRGGVGAGVGVGGGVLRGGGRESREASVPRYMQNLKKPSDTGATAGELARVWDMGLRAGFYGRTDPSEGGAGEEGGGGKGSQATSPGVGGGAGAGAGGGGRGAGGGGGSAGKKSGAWR